MNVVRQFRRLTSAFLSGMVAVGLCSWAAGAAAPSAPTATRPAPGAKPQAASLATAKLDWTESFVQASRLARQQDIEDVVRELAARPMGTTCRDRVDHVGEADTTLDIRRVAQRDVLPRLGSECAKADLPAEVIRVAEADRARRPVDLDVRHPRARSVERGEQAPDHA